MFFRSLAELGGDMPEGTLREEVQDTASGPGNPTDGLSPVHKSQGLDPVNVSCTGRPGAYSAERGQFPPGHSRGGHFYAVHPESSEEELRNGEFFPVIERHSGGLLPVP